MWYGARVRRVRSVAKANAVLRIERSFRSRQSRVAVALWVVRFRYLARGRAVVALLEVVVGWRVKVL